jgi:hypothetical protein
MRMVLASQGQFDAEFVAFDFDGHCHKEMW